jgi:hypothetical protein
MAFSSASSIQSASIAALSASDRTDAATPRHVDPLQEVDRGVLDESLQGGRTGLPVAFRAAATEIGHTYTGRLPVSG